MRTCGGVVTSVLLLAAPVFAQQRAAPPIEIEVRWSEDAHEVGGNGSWIKVEWWAHFQVDTFTNPITGRKGAASCTGYETVIAEIKDGDVFCFRLHYATGGASGTGRGSGSEGAVTVTPSAPPPPTTRFSTFGVSIIRSDDGRVTMQLAGGGYELSDPTAATCLPAEPELVLTYNEVRGLTQLTKTWTSSSKDLPGWAETCRGTVKVTARALGHHSGD